MTWEERTKVGATLLSLVAIVIGGSQFIQNQRILAATPFLQKKLEWCEKAVKTVSALAVNDQPNPEDEQEFWQLYWGLMVLIENESIETAMVEFGEALEGSRQIESGAKNSATPLIGLRGASLGVARACRRELAEEWSPSWLRQGNTTEVTSPQNSSFPSSPNSK